MYDNAYVIQVIKDVFHERRDAITKEAIKINLDAGSDKTQIVSLTYALKQMNELEKALIYHLTI